MQETILITGGSRGIGRAIAQRALREGYAVANFDIQPPVEPLQGEEFTQVDLADPAQTASAVAALASRHEVTRLVNNAGVVHPAPLERATAQDMDTVAAVNLRAPMLLTQGLLPTMRAKRFGRIVNISSRAALGKLERTVYAATKAGLLGMTRTWALELAEAGITVNAVGPGPIATELFERVNPPGSPQTRKIIESIPVRRMGQPAEVAHAVMMFLDERAGFMTGQVVYICGGITVGLD